jgi:hypothetical protein
LEDVDAALELNDEYEGWHILRGSICYVSGPRNYVLSAARFAARTRCASIRRGNLTGRRGRQWATLRALRSHT